MLSPEGQSDRFLIIKETKLVGQRSGKFIFSYVCEHFHQKQMAHSLTMLGASHHLWTQALQRYYSSKQTKAIGKKICLIKY